MTRTFIQTDEFSRNWDEFGFTDDDLRRLEFDIMMNPHKYPVMQGTGGLRKARFAFKHHGKSGGVRVCYVDFVIEETIYLITVYSKNRRIICRNRNEITLIYILTDFVTIYNTRSCDYEECI